MQLLKVEVWRVERCATSGHVSVRVREPFLFLRTNIIFSLHIHM